MTDVTVVGKDEPESEIAGRGTRRGSRRALAHSGPGAEPGRAADRLAHTLRDRVESDDIRLEVVPAEAAAAHCPSTPAVRRDSPGFRRGGRGQARWKHFPAARTRSWSGRRATTPPIQGFFDRTKLRATLRKSQERRSASVAHAEKLTALGTLVAGVAHEINNPLTVLQFGLEACSSLLAPLTGMAQEVPPLGDARLGREPRADPDAA